MKKVYRSSRGNLLSYEGVLISSTFKEDCIIRCDNLVIHSQVIVMGCIGNAVHNVNGYMQLL